VSTIKGNANLTHFTSVTDETVKSHALIDRASKNTQLHATSAGGGIIIVIGELTADKF